MGKTGKWFRSFLGSNKKEKEKEEEKEKGRKEKDEEREKTGVQPFSNSSSVNENQSNPRSNPPKEKRRWSFRRSAATRDSNSQDPIAANPTQACRESESEQKQHSVAVDTAAPTDAAATVAQATAAMVRIANVANSISSSAKEAAAIKIQSVFRSHLARKALCALRGLVKLQALVRGHLVRKQATATLRCMQALVTVQARARAQRLRVAEDPQLAAVQRQSTHRKSSQENRLRLSYEMERSMEDNVKIVEMDLGESRGGLKSRNSYSNPQSERSDPRFSSYYPVHRGQSKQDQFHISPAPLALTDQSPRASSGHFEEYSFTTTQSSPQHFSAISRPDPTRTPFSLRSEYAESLPQDYPFFPSYMANTESSRAKARSQSAPKQRPESCEKVATTKRRVSIEGRNVPRSLRMQRSSSHVGSTGNGYQQYGWPIKLDRSTMSLKDSEHGSTCSVLTNANYCRSLIAIEGQGNRY